ncbi:MAG: outer membrane protein transport protein [Pseudomonadota bacterium]
MKKIILFISLFFIISSLSLLANTVDTATKYGAKASGMASGGAVAMSGNSGLVYFNPATIAGVRNSDFTVNFTSGIPVMSGPANGAGTSVDSAFLYFPLFNIGGALRLHDYVVLGFNAYNSGGLGAKYDDINFGNSALTAREMSAQTSVMELGPTLALDLPYGLSLGVAYKVSYVAEDIKSYDATGAYSDMSLTGLNYMGFKFGLQYEPIEDLSFGASYRLATTTTLSGSSTVSATAGTAIYDAATDFEYVDQVRAGVEYKMLDKKLSIGTDFEYTFYSKVDSADFDLSLSGTTVTSSNTLNWNDQWGAYLGSEYYVIEKLPVRIGGGVYSDIVPAGYASSLYPAPGLGWLVSAGASYEFTSFEAGFWYNYYSAQGRVASTVSTTFPGDYSTSIHLVGLEFRFAD